VRRLELTESARADLKSIRRYSLRAWGGERTERYMVTLRDAMKTSCPAGHSAANVRTFGHGSG
jgi:plasmid stabilization system protein ParE